MTNKIKSSAKSVTAPLAYNPGKGRPKEHLAYLNYQEMQALKRLNGNNQERGPRGLPSFPPADATSGRNNSGYVSGGSRPSRGGPRYGVSGSVSPSSGSPRGSNPPSGGGGSNSGSRPSGGMMGGTGSGGSSRTSSSVGSGNKGNVGGMRSGPGGTGGYKTPGAGGSNADRAAINAANKANTLSAQKAPAFKADTGRTVNVGPMGTPVNVNAPPGGKIKGAIQGVKAAQTVSRGVAIPTATVQSPMATQGTSFASPLDARIENFQRINDARIRAGALGPEGVPSVSQIAVENASRLNAAKMAQQYSQYRSPPRGYPAAPQGVYGPRAGVGTGYLGTADMPGMITTGMTSPYSGTIKPRFNAAQTLMAYEAEKRVPGKIQDRVPPTERFRPPARGIGDIPQSYPNTPPPGIPSGFKVEKSNIRRDRFGEPVLREKEVTDRLLQEPSYRPYDIRVTSPPAPIMGVSFDTGLKNKIQDRILPQSEYAGYGGSAPPRTRSIGDVQLPQSQYSGYEKFNAPSPSEKVPGVKNIMSDAGIVKNIPGYTPSAPQNDLQRQGAETYTSSYDVPPSYPNYGPPGGVRGLGGFTPATPTYKNVSPISPSSMPYDVRLGEVKISVPMGDENRKVVIGSTTIDKYVEAMPDLTSAEKANLRRSMIGKTVAGDGKLEFTVEEVLQMKDEAKGEAMVADGVAEDYGLVGEEAAKAAKKAGFPRNVYTNEDFLGDPDQLGLTREEVAMPLSPDDMAKVVNRSRALRYDDVDPYLTGPEKVRAKVSDVVERIVTFGAPTKAAVGAAKKLMSIESPEKFLSRPSYEQQALYEYAREANTRYRPGEAGVPQSYGPGGSETVGGGSRFGGDGLGGGDKGNSGISSLGPKPKGDETTTPSPDTPSTTPGRRPDIYYMWDLGINIPSPSDPNYNQYQTYLAERLAAQRAMGYV